MIFLPSGTRFRHPEELTLSGYQNDEEQLEALKSWWKENGSSLITGVIVVLAVFFGVRQWQSSQDAQAGIASDLYQQIADIVIDNLTQSVDDNARQVVMSSYNELKSGFADSIYTRYAALAVAKLHVDQDALDDAAAELQWILDNPELGFMQEADAELFIIARLRLAMVRVAQEQYQAALDLLDDVEPGTFAPGFAETRGDALYGLGRREEALAAYERALAANTEGNPVLLQLKMQDLGWSQQEIF
jgi:predicted negative regulator of RcsB-dependent stress response